MGLRPRKLSAACQRHAACRDWHAACCHPVACRRRAVACCHCAACRLPPPPCWCASRVARVAEDHDGNHQVRTKLCRPVTSTRRVPHAATNAAVYATATDRRLLPSTAATCRHRLHLALSECQEILLSDGLGVHEANWMLGVLFSCPINSLHAVQFDKKKLLRYNIMQSTVFSFKVR